MSQKSGIFNFAKLCQKNVGFLLAGTLGLGYGHAATVCGAVYESGLGVMVENTDQSLDFYICDSVVISPTQISDAERHCIDYKTKTQSGSTYSLTGCTYKSIQCPWHARISTYNGHNVCESCPANFYALDMHYIFNNAGFVPGLYHTKTTCDYCANGYYKIGSNCVACPTISTSDDAMDIITINTQSGEPTRGSWGDGGIETCWYAGTGRANTPTIYTRTDSTGTYETGLDFTTVPLNGQTVEMLFCPYQ